MVSVIYHHPFITMCLLFCNESSCNSLGNPDGTACDYAGILYNLYSLAVETAEVQSKRCIYSQAYRDLPTQPPFFYMGRHLADWVAPFPRRQHPPPPLLKFLDTPSIPLLHSTCTRVIVRRPSEFVVTRADIVPIIFFLTKTLNLKKKYRGGRGRDPLKVVAFGSEKQPGWNL